MCPRLGVTTSFSDDWELPAVTALYRNKAGGIIVYGDDLLDHIPADGTCGSEPVAHVGQGKDRQDRDELAALRMTRTGQR